MLWGFESPLSHDDGHLHEVAVFFGVPGMGTTLEVQVLPKVGHNNRSEARLRKGDRLWESSV